jgi:hypothetical protein
MEHSPVQTATLINNTPPYKWIRTGSSPHIKIQLVRNTPIIGKHPVHILIERPFDSIHIKAQEPYYPYYDQDGKYQFDVGITEEEGVEFVWKVLGIRPSATQNNIKTK